MKVARTVWTYTKSVRIVRDEIAQNLLEDTIISALDYEYDDYIYTGNSVYSDLTVTTTYNMDYLSDPAVEIMNDLARYLGALYRVEDLVVELTYDGEDYTWNEAGTLKGSNWEDSEGATLVSAIVTALGGAADDIVITVSDGTYSVNLSFNVTIEGDV